MKREVFQQSSSFPVLNKCQDCQDLCFHSFQMINRNFNQKIINTVDSKFISEVQILNPISLNPTQSIINPSQVRDHRTVQQWRTFTSFF